MEIDDVGDFFEIEKLLNDIDWREFEQIVGKIFEFHEYDVDVSKVVTFENTKRQYDVTAKCSEYCVVTDCKNWDNKRRIKSGLKKAVEKQIERVEMLDNDIETFPLIVTSSRNPVEYFSGVPIVPIFKLNRFLLGFEFNKEKMKSV